MRFETKCGIEFDGTIKLRDRNINGDGGWINEIFLDEKKGMPDAQNQWCGNRIRCIDMLGLCPLGARYKLL